MSIACRLFPIICGIALVSCAAPETQIPETTTTTPPVSTTPSVTTPPATTPPVVQPQQGQMLPITATATIVSTGKTFDLEVTETDEQRQMGLMYRESLPDDRGMLFEFYPPQPVRFWMKNCRMNLDMIFLRDGVVQAIAKDVPPCESDPCPTYGTPAEIDQVIEIRGRLADEIGLKEGDRIEVESIRN